MAASENLIPARFIDEPEWADDLDQALTPVDAPEWRPAVPEAAARWSIQNAGSAEWAMRRWAELVAQAKEVQQQADEWRDPIDRWEKAELSRLQGRIDFFYEHLEAYGLEQRRLHPKEATIRLPSGTITTRQQTAPTIHLDDEDAFLVWAMKLDDDEAIDAMVKVTASAKLTEIRKLTRTRPRPEPWCRECGAQIVEQFGDLEPFDGTWTHVGPPEEEWDHDPIPIEGLEVVYGEREVPGLVAVPPMTTAHPKPA